MPLSIRSVIQEKADALIEKVRREGQLDVSDLKELKDLDELSSILLAFRKRSRKSKLVPLLIGLVTLAILSVLMFCRISKADISLDADVTALSFDIAERTDRNVLDGIWPLSSLSIEKADQLILPLRKPVQNSRRSSFASFNSGTAGKIVVSSMFADSGTHVDFWKDLNNAYHIRLKPKPGGTVSISVAIGGNVELSYPEEDSRQVSFPFPDEVAASSVGHPLVLVLVALLESCRLARKVPDDV
jgi:hypothetical protein